MAVLANCPQPIDRGSDLARWRNDNCLLVLNCTETPAEVADVFETNVQYLYNDGEFWHFMHPESFEQSSVDKDAMADAVYWMQEEGVCNRTLFNGEPLSVSPPNFVEMQIIETDPGLKGDTSGGGGKPAKLESGATVRVPLFVQNEEVIRIDTRTGEYVSRVKG